VLQNDVAEMDGESVILETVALDRSRQEKVVARFKSDRDQEYREFISKCSEFKAEIAKESKARRFDYAEIEENAVNLKKLQS